MLPEAVGDVLEIAVQRLAVQMLVGGGLTQGAEVTDVGTHLDIVEVGLAHRRGDAEPTAVPSYLQLRILFVDVLRQQVHSLRVGIASHHGDAGDVICELADELVNGIGVQGKPDVLPQIVAVTAWAVAGAIADVDGQRHLVGYLLEHDASVYVL